MNLKLVYNVAYPEQTPFVESDKSLYNFNYATILLGMLDEIDTNPADVSFIGLFLYYMNKADLTLDDLNYYFTYRLSDYQATNYAVDEKLYKRYSKNELYEKLNKAKEIIPEMFTNIPSVTRNINEDNVSYSKLLLTTMRFETIKGVLKNNRQKKDFSQTKNGKIFSAFIDAFYGLYDNVDEYQKLVNELVKREDISQKDIYDIMKKMLDTCTNPKVQIATNAYQDFKLNNKTKNMYKNESWKNITKLPDYVIGQDFAVNKVIEKLMGANVGFKSEQEPVASFLFTGPTGVGKTETAKAIANLCYNGNIYTVDMASFKNDTDVSRLLGAAPNYVGYSDKNEFCSFIKEHPKCVLLFDEIDKAHHGCLDLLMRMIDEAEFINAKGEVISLKDAVIICTTNYSENKTSVTGFGSSEKTEEQIVGGFGFRKEMVGRFSEVIEYKRLSKDACKKIAEKYFLKKCIVNFQSKNANKKIKLRYDDSLLNKIVEDANTNLFGARDLKKSIQKNFISPVSAFLIKNNVNNVTLTITENGIETDKEIKTKPKEIGIEK